MKKLIIISIFLSIWMGSMADTRPPIRTDRLELGTTFTWSGDYVWKDTLNYIWMISPTCFKVKHIGVIPWSGPYCFDKAGADSIKMQWNGKWVKPGGTITTPPTLVNINAFTNINLIAKIKVTAASLAAYQAATNWSDASIINHIVSQ